MFFKRFRFQVILRIVLLSLSIYAFFFFLLKTKLYATIFITVFFILLQVYSLIRYVERTNQNLQRFFLAIKYEDFSRSFSGKELGTSFAELISAFNDVIEKMQQTRSEKEEQYRYLQTVVHHVGIGLITFQPDGKVSLINTSAKRLLQVGHLMNIKDLESFSKPLVKKLFTLKPGQKALVKVAAREMELVVRAAEFRMHEQKYTLVSLQNIRSELQEKEMEAWQILIRVLTHEIMNSMTPITSMAATVLDLLKSLKQQEGEIPGHADDGETVADIGSALKTIHKRSQGLTEFVSAYRNLTLIPKPKFKIFSIEELFVRVEKLMESKLKEKGIQLHWFVDPQSLELTADPGLIEQVLINLFLNAGDALEDREKPRIEMTACLNESGRVVISFKDNGKGIVKEALENIFIPFFTTKKKGSGIGLSLSRQILKLHHGTISVQSTSNKGTVFTLKF